MQPPAQYPPQRAKNPWSPGAIHLFWSMLSEWKMCWWDNLDHIFQQSRPTDLKPMQPTEPKSKATMRRRWYWCTGMCLFKVRAGGVCVGGGDCGDMRVRSMDVDSEGEVDSVSRSIFQSICNSSREFHLEFFSRVLFYQSVCQSWQ